MDTETVKSSTGPTSALVCGVILAGAAIKELLSHVTESGIVVAPKAPSVIGVMVAGAMTRDALLKLGGAS